MLKASTPIHPPPSSSHPTAASLKLSSTSPLVSPALDRSRSSAVSSPTPSLDSPPISSFAKRYRATPLPTPTMEVANSPFTPLSSADATPSVQTPNAVHSDSEDEEVSSLVRRTSGKGFRVQENVRRGSSRRAQNERRTSSSSQEEERRKSAAQKVEDSRIKVKAARKMEEQLAQGIQPKEIPVAGEGELDQAEGEQAQPTLSSYSRDMERHMVALMAKLEVHVEAESKKV